MKKNPTKRQQIRTLEILIASTEENIKYTSMLSTATTPQLLEAERTIIKKIVHIQSKQKNRENPQFYGLLHLAGKKLYYITAQKMEDIQLAKLTQHLTYVRHTVLARQNGTHEQSIKNLEKQLEHYNTSLKIMKSIRQDFTQEK